MLQPFGQLPGLTALPGGITPGSIGFEQFLPVHPELQKQRP
jgi:hypothetical protein